MRQVAVVFKEKKEMLKGYKILKDNVETLEDWRAAADMLVDKYTYMVESMPPVAAGDCTGLPG